ncbi:hypothetical protein EV128_12824 [Rhizobium azibense]|nr:hypothetical protein EV128_12824 [Rhizobium azibense]
MFCDEARKHGDSEPGGRGICRHDIAARAEDEGVRAEFRFQPARFGHAVTIQVKSDEAGWPAFRNSLGGRFRGVESVSDRRHAFSGEITVLRVPQPKGNIGLALGKALHADIGDDSSSTFASPRSTSPSRGAMTRSAIERVVVSRTRPLGQSAALSRDLPDPLGGMIPAETVHRTALAEIADRFATVVPNVAAIVKRGRNGLTGRKKPSFSTASCASPALP